MSHASSETVARADQVLAILREAEEPMTSAEVGKRVGYALPVRCHGGAHGEDERRTITRLCQGDGTDLLVRRGMLGSHLRPALDVLLHSGRVTREKVGTRLYWSYVARAEDAEAKAILAQLGWRIVT